MMKLLKIVILLIALEATARAELEEAPMQKLVGLCVRGIDFINDMEHPNPPFR
jgi:hypothetical protein